VGRSEKAFHKNCVALGLAGGFVEPLEATAIYMVEMGIRWLLSYFPDREFDPALAKRCNTITDTIYDEVRDFIIIHYYLNNRTDTPYWIAAREDIEVPDRLVENLEVWKYALPQKNDFPTEHLFTFWNYLMTLFGKGYYPIDHEFPNAQGIQVED
jgi:tryptophan halogenase